ncbi:histidinol-phosphate transaminase [Streptomyces sp. T-3]|nr:histidinol-phosphate transaminase [Streptomyces sp. T-3]
MSEPTVTERAPRFRPVLDTIATFSPERVARSPEGRSHPLSGNESPHAPLPAVVRAISEAARGANRYPDPHCGELIAAISGRFSVPEDRVAVGPGSVAVLQMALAAAAGPGHEVVYAWRSFEAYRLLTKLAGATAVEVPLRSDGTHDLAAMAAAINDRTRLVLVCTPNNPTGTVLHRPELEAFLHRVPAHCLVVIDEAYREYVRDTEAPDALTLGPGRPNVLVLRTFSKAYGLAGLRVGYAVGHPAAITTIRKTGLPYAVNSLAQAAAVASLRARDELTARVEAVTRERDRVRAALTAQGQIVPRSEANFLWLPLALPGQALDLAAHLAAAGVTVRPFPGDGVRVSIGSPEDNDAFVRAAAAFAVP